MVNIDVGQTIVDFDALFFAPRLKSVDRRLIVIEFSITEGTTVKALLALMVDTWGTRFAAYFSDAEQDHTLPKIRILVNGRDIGFLNGMETELRDGDEVLMLPLVGGG